MVLKKAKSIAAFAAMLISGVSASHAMLDKESENIKAYSALLSTRAKNISSLRGVEKNLQYFTEDSQNKLYGRLNELNNLKLDLKSTNKQIHILEKKVPNIKLLHDQYKELEEMQSLRSHSAKVIAEKRVAWFENFDNRRILEARKTRLLQAQ